jgi:hypothetical protein
MNVTMYVCTLRISYALYNFVTLYSCSFPSGFESRALLSLESRALLSLESRALLSLESRALLSLE